jgi:hypothetical protein
LQREQSDRQKKSINTEGDSQTDRKRIEAQNNRRNEKLELQEEESDMQKEKLELQEERVRQAEKGKKNIQTGGMKS